MIEPESKPDADYTTQQAADLCSISINTLLAWERRYGVPAPRRDERNERLYDANDIRIIRWLQSQTAQGTPIGKAVLLLSELDQDTPPTETASEDVVVALDVSRRVRTEAIQAPVVREHATESQADRWRRELIAALCRYDRATVASILSTAALETSPLLATTRVIHPSMQAMARRYERGDLDRATVTIAERWLSARIAHWLDIVEPDREQAQATSVLVADGTPWSSVPALSVALQLAHDGNHIIDLPPDSPAEVIRSIVKMCDASRVLFYAGEGGTRRDLDARIDLLRAVLPDTVTIARIEEQAPSTLPDHMESSDSAEGIQMRTTRIVTGILNHAPDAAS